MQTKTIRLNPSLSEQDVAERLHLAMCQLDYADCSWDGNGWDQPQSSISNCRSTHLVRAKRILEVTGGDQVKAMQIIEAVFDPVR